MFKTPRHPSSQIDSDSPFCFCFGLKNLRLLRCTGAVITQCTLARRASRPISAQSRHPWAALHCTFSQMHSNAGLLVLLSLYFLDLYLLGYKTAQDCTVSSQNVLNCIAALQRTCTKLQLLKFVFVFVFVFVLRHCTVGKFECSADVRRRNDSV